MNNLAQRVYQELIKNGEMTPVEISKVLRISIVAAMAALKVLERLGKARNLSMGDTGESWPVELGPIPSMNNPFSGWGKAHPWDY